MRNHFAKMVTEAAESVPYAPTFSMKIKGTRGPPPLNCCQDNEWSRAGCLGLSHTLLCSGPLQRVAEVKRLPLRLHKAQAALTDGNVVGPDEIQAVSSSDHPAAAD